MSATSLTDGMIRLILSTETSPSRFELFCIDLYSKVDGRRYVPTSYNYDQGRDGRSADVSASEGNLAVLCISLRQDVIDKASEDASSLFSHAQPTLVRFCSNQAITERVVDKIADVFRAAAGSLQSVIVEGLLQILPLASHYPELVEKHYPGEVANLRIALGVTEIDDDAIQLTGMRIALTSQLSDDAAAMRDDVQRNLILTALSDERPCNLAALANRISQLLHLPRSIRADYLYSTTHLLLESDAIRKDDSDRFVITETGKQELSERTAKGSSRLAEGQAAVRRALQELSGDAPDGEQFARLWSVFQDHIANMFLVNGIYITDSVASIIEGGSTLADHPDLQHHIDELAKRVEGLAVWGHRGPEIAQAIRDMFDDSTSDAFRWLSDLCLVYISVCSLGLDRHSQDQVAARLREIDLLLDTDVVLSFLSKGEPLHDAITTVVTGWRRLNGNLYVCPSVLEETAYHAWIAERDYQEVWRQLSKMDYRDALRLINNAFVRGFRAEAGGCFEPKRWNYYIRHFRGAAEYDYGQLLSVLKEDRILPLMETGNDGQFAARVAKDLIRNLAQQDRHQEDDLSEVPQRIKDKCDRDGRLVAVLRGHRNARMEIGTALIVSSSQLLRRGCHLLRKELGAPEAVVSVGAVAYLLTLAPGINVSLGSLRGILFDVRYRAQLPPLERVVMRIIYASKEYMLPFSRRAALRPLMREKIALLAQQRGQKPAVLAEQIQAGDESVAEDFATTVASIVDTIARSESEKRLERMRRY